MSTALSVDQEVAIRHVTAETVGLDVLLLYGSRSRGDARESSDWDFGYLGANTDQSALLAAVVECLGTDAIDLVDLDRASGLLRFRAARDGVTVFARRPRLDDQFRYDAAQFWCDAGPVIERGYDAVLKHIRP